MATKKNTARTARINLNVPFPAHKAAKAMGAYYDTRAKVWYTYAGHHDLKRFARFMATADQKVYLA